MDFNTEIGEASRKSAEMSVAATCHKSRAAATEIIFNILLFIIEIIVRQLAANRSGIVVEKRLQIAL